MSENTAFVLIPSQTLCQFSLHLHCLANSMYVYDFPMIKFQINQIYVRLLLYIIIIFYYYYY